MKYGEQNDGLVKRRLMDEMIDIYWGVVTPTQALTMLAGEGPEAPKHLVSQIKRLFVEKEKIMNAKELKTLEKIVGLYKDYEHGKLKEISGAEIDVLLKDANEYDKALKELRKNLEKRMVEHGADALHTEVFTLLENAFGKHGKEEMVKQFEKNLIKTGKLPPRLMPILHKVETIKQKARAAGFSQHDMDSVRRDAEELIMKISEYLQRRDLIKAERGVIKLMANNRLIEIILTEKTVFAIDAGKVLKFHSGAFVASDANELDAALKSSKEIAPKLSDAVLTAVKKHFGAFEVAL